MKSIQMYMPNASPSAREPNTTYIPLAHVGARVGCTRICVGRGDLHWVCGDLGRVRNGFKYQHVGIPNAKFSRCQDQRTAPTQESRVAVEYRLKILEMVSARKRCRHQYETRTTVNDIPNKMLTQISFKMKWTEVEAYMYVSCYCFENKSKHSQKCYQGNVSHRWGYPIYSSFLKTVFVVER